MDGTSQPAQEAELAAAMGDVPRPPRLVYRWAPEDAGLTAARNRGVGLAGGDIIQFMDDDTTVAPDYFEQLSRAFEPADVGGAAGRLIDPVAEAHGLRRWLFRCCYVGPFRQRAAELFLWPPRALTETNTLPGASAYRREAFAQFRFDEALTGPGVGEDLDFSYRVGNRWRLVIQPAAQIVHHRSPEERQASRKNFADKVGFYHYHFRKNMGGSPVEWAAYLWLNAGFALDALLRLRTGPLLGLLDGWRRVARRGLLSRPPRVPPVT